MATTRRRFTAEFKARVVVEALRGDRTIQEIGAKHHVHPNQVSGWKRQAQDGLRELFADGASRRQVLPASRRFQTVPSRIAAARLALMPGGRQRGVPPTAGGG